jgi:ABC-type uncharacterized transport system involved in gliding motility auxiliary subunit
METLKKSLNYVAPALILAALAAWFVWPYKKVVVLALGAAGLLAFLAYVALNLPALKRGFRRKAFLYGGNSVLVVILVLAILVLVNYFLSEHHYRMDLTAAKVHSLSDQSLTVLKNLKTDVAIKGFFRLSNESRGALENLLRIYGYNSGRIRYEFIDPDRNPNLVKQYDITQDGTTVFEAGGRKSRITSFGEEDVTNALIQVTRARKKVIYFLEGHGEETPAETGDNGYSTAKAELEKLGYEVKTQTLALASGFPKDCALLVVPGPQKDLLPNELETVKAYVQGGGRLYVMVDPLTTISGLRAFLAGYGFQLDDDVIVDTVSRLLGGDDFMPVVSEYEDHAITRKFGYATFYPLARSVEAGPVKPEGETLTALAKTSPNSWAEKELNDKQVRFHKDKDRQGPVTLAAVASLKVNAAASAAASAAAPAKPGEKAPEDKKAEEKEARLAVVGDSDFAKNRYFNLSGNGNFFLNIANWLTEESDLISIRPRTQAPRTIQLTPVQMSLVSLVVFYVLPLAVLVLGLALWFRRRSL